MRRTALALLALLAAPVAAQVSTFPYSSRVYSVTDLNTNQACSATLKGRVFGVYDGASASDCTTGSGSTAVLCQCDGSAWVARGRFLGGSFTTNRLVKASGAFTLADSIILCDGTNCSIGTASPAAKFHIQDAVPTFRLVDTDVSGYYEIRVANAQLQIRADEDNAHANTSIGIRVDGAEVGRFDGTSLALGTTSPQKRLHVNHTSDTDVVRWQDSDGTCDQNPESGSLVTTCSSTERGKKNIRPADVPAVVARLRSIVLSDYETVATDETKRGHPVAELNRHVPELVVDRETEICVPRLTEPGVEDCVPGPPDPSVVGIPTWQLVAALQWILSEIERLHPGPGPPGPGRP